MKPVKLVIQAFGAFSSFQEINFILPDNRSLFLIHGPTGAGKTTILDAICFALYGETSGNERDPSGMRSHHASPDITTEVTFEFILSDKKYRVTRIPEQERIKTRGIGTTRKPSVATLWLIDNNSETETVLADRWSRVTEKIESILGFRSDQFRQVVILPQGQFRKLLSANSQERQAILAVLFKTEWFKRIEDELKERARTVKASFETLSEQKTFILKETGVEKTEQASEKFQTLTDNINQLETSINELRLVERQKLAVLNESRLVEQKFLELNVLRDEFTLLQNRKSEIDVINLQFEQASKANNLRTDWEYLKKLKVEHEQIVNKQKITDNAFKEIKKRKETVEKELATALNNEPVRDALNIELEELRKLQPRVSELERSKDSFQKKKQDLNSCENLKTAKKEHIQKIRSALLRLQEELDRIKETAFLLEKRKRDLSDAENGLKQAAKRSQLEIDANSIQKTIDETNQKNNQCLILLKNEREKLERLEIARLEGQASVLGSKLQPGKPCPVCGSIEHPSISIGSTNIPDESEISSCKMQIQKLENTRDSHRNEGEKYKEKLSSIQKEISLISESLNSLPGNDPQYLSNWFNECTKLVAESEVAGKRVATITADKARGDNTLINSEKELEMLEQKQGTAVSEFSAETTRYEQLQAEVPEMFRFEGALQKIIGDKTKQLKELTDSIDYSRKNNESVRDQFAAAESSLTLTTEAYQVSTSKLQQGIAEFDLKRRASNFTTNEQFVSALISESQIKKLEDTVRQYSHSIHSAQERVSRSELECSQTQRPDMVLLESEYSQLRLQLDSISSQIGAAINEREQLEKHLQELSSIQQQILKLEEQYKVIGSLSEVASGGNPLRITFERFVLASLLDEVLFAGTRRLKIMSKGRFELQRARTHDDQRTSGGLDLLVFDSWTGTTRPVSSLSGGESFLAALSLALGLADIVQSYSGGIRLETMFIDEGFGSLDSEALDLAFCALMDLGRGGRLIGIISHVPELKERIETRLEIIPERNGSRTRFWK
jgi:exonuclease SbcC